MPAGMARVVADAVAEALGHAAIIYYITQIATCVIELQSQMSIRCHVLSAILGFNVRLRRPFCILRMVIATVV